jgi:hypothetical protein
MANPKGIKVKDLEELNEKDRLEWYPVLYKMLYESIEWIHSNNTKRIEAIEKKLKM